MSRSGWWSSASAASATRFTKAIALLNVGNVKVFCRTPPRRDQPGSEPSSRWMAMSERTVGGIAVVGVGGASHDTTPAPRGQRAPVAARPHIDGVGDVRKLYIG